jgi:hypothetical protein
MNRLASILSARRPNMGCVNSADVRTTTSHRVVDSFTPTSVP